MQLLDSEQLEFAFRLHGITLEAQARRFYGDLWQIIQDAEKTTEASELRAYERQLRELCHNYFAVVRDWRQEQEEAGEHLNACSVSRDNAREASNALPLFEKQFFRYVLCYMELNRAIIRARVRISYFVHDHKIEDYGKDLDVNHGTGILLARAHRELAGLQQKLSYLERMKTLLRGSDAQIEELGDTLPRLYPVEGDRQLTLFKGALRRSEFAVAEKIVGAWKSESLRAQGRRFVKTIQKNAAHLKIGEGLVLHSGEVSLPLSVLRSDEGKAREFLDKYNVPYMVFQFKALLHLGYLLGRIGSIEALIIQHAKLAAISARLQADANYAKAQQQAVLLPVRTLLESRFSSLGPLFNDMETIQAMLEKLIVQTREYQAHTKA